MRRRLAEISDLLICVLLTGAAISLLYSNQMKSAEAIATLVGALFGSAALLLGNWISRWNERSRAREDMAQRISKLRILIAAELVNVAAGLISAKGLMDAAVATARSGGALPEHQDFAQYIPRSMPFTDDLGSDLAMLAQRDIDVLATLRSNLAITRMTMDQVTLGRERFGLLTAQRLKQGLGHDMTILKRAFQQFAPDRKLALNGNDPELATTILDRLAGG